MRALPFALVILAFTSVVRADPKIDYLLYCRGCHLANGAGVSPVVPTLIDEVGRLLQVNGGREYIVRVPGVSQTEMNDAKLAAVLNWVVSEFNSGTTPDDFEPYTGEYIASVRDKVLADPLRYRAKLLAVSQ
ncbi:MAG: c-type cytochrome [Woeseiaceae bacterium]